IMDTKLDPDIVRRNVTSLSLADELSKVTMGYALVYTNSNDNFGQTMKLIRGHFNPRPTTINNLSFFDDLTNQGKDIDSHCLAHALYIGVYPHTIDKTSVTQDFNHPQLLKFKGAYLGISFSSASASIQNIFPHLLDGAQRIQYIRKYQSMDIITAYKEVRDKIEVQMLYGPNKEEELSTLKKKEKSLLQKLQTHTWLAKIVNLGKVIFN
ncbi:hypothetical protein H0H93_000707, partial [Arthromyces matolae]